MLLRTPFDERLKPTTFGEIIKICKSIKVKKVEYIYVYVLAHCMEHSGAVFFFLLTGSPNANHWNYCYIYYVRHIIDAMDSTD